MAVLWETGREGYCFITCEAAQTPIDHAISEILEYACIPANDNRNKSSSHIPPDGYVGKAFRPFPILRRIVEGAFHCS